MHTGFSRALAARDSAAEIWRVPTPASQRLPSITFYPLVFKLRELLHRDRSVMLRLDRWGLLQLYAAAPLHFGFLRSADLPYFVRLLWLCFGLVS